MPISHLLPLFLLQLTIKMNGCLDVVPEDVVVDNIFTYLTVEEILSMRRVSKRYCRLTHTPLIWKRFLRHVDIPLPPIPPTPRYSFTRIDLEAEKLVIRGISLDDNWKDYDTKSYMVRSFQAHEEVLEMTLLPGGKYLVASIRGPGMDDYALIVFLLDHPSGFTVPLAKTNTVTKAYDLQAKYMAYKGVKGIVIAYARRDFRRAYHREHGIDPSEYILDLPHPIQSECICLHISLNSLEGLGDSNILPASPEFCQQLINQPSPFHEIYKTSTASVLDNINLIEVNGMPWVTFVKRPFIFRPQHGQEIPPEEIVFKDLDSGKKRRMCCKPWEAMNDFRQIIWNVRVIPSQMDVLVVRSIPQPLPLTRYSNYLLELYKIPDPDSFELEGLTAWDSRIVQNMQISSFHITEYGHPALNDPSLQSTLRPTVDRPAPISIFWRTSSPEHKLYHNIIWPSRVGTVGYTFKLGNMIQQSLRMEKEKTMHVLPGIDRSLVYTVPADDDSPSPPLLQLKKYITHHTTPQTDDFDPGPEPYEVSEDDRIMKPASLHPYDRFGDIILPHSLRVSLLEKGIKFAAWDEGVGRACIAAGGDKNIVYILDFAQTPLLYDKVPPVPSPLPVLPPRGRHGLAARDTNTDPAIDIDSSIVKTTKSSGKRRATRSPTPRPSGCPVRRKKVYPS